MSPTELTAAFVTAAMLAIAGCGNAVEGDSKATALGENAATGLPTVSADSANNVSPATGDAEPSLAPSASAPPGPQSWVSFRNGHAQAGVAGSTLPQELDLLWKYPDADGFLTAVAIVGPHVYAPGLSGYLYCLDRTSGELIWKYRSIEDADPETFAPGFKAAPTVTADTVYLGDEDGLFHAVDRANGAQRWVFTTEAEIAGGAAVVGDQVIFGSHDSFLYCLNASDGSLVWKFQTEDRVNCSVAIAGKHTFVAGCDEHLRVIDIEGGGQTSDIPLRSYLIASPAVVDNMLYVGTYASEVVAVDWKQKEVVWRYRDPRRELPYHASAAVTDQYVVVGGRDKQMHCIERATGNGVWTFPTRGRIDSSAVIVDERVFFGSADRNLYGLQLSNGKEIWKFNAEKPVSAGAAVGEGCLVIGSEGPDGFLYCFGEKPRD